MRLREYIAILKGEDPNRVLPWGLGKPDSYRGDYSELAFAIVPDIAVGTMLEKAQSMVGAMVTGYKGGDYYIYETTQCWISEWGRCSDVPLSNEALYILFEIARQNEARARKSD